MDKLNRSALTITGTNKPISSDLESFWDHPKLRRPLKYLNLLKALVVSRITPATPFVRFIPTDACNLSCAYCWQRREDPYQMSKEDFDQYLDKAKSHHLGMVTFLGGEPMTWRHLYEGIAECNRNNIITDMTTNGTALTQKNIFKLAQAGLDFLNISVDGITKTNVSDKNSLVAKEGILDNLQKAREQFGMRYRVNAVIYKNNFEEIKQLMEFSYKNNVPISLGYIIPPIKKGFLGDPSKYFTLEDRELLEEIITYIITKRRQGYPVIDPEEYFEGIFKYLNGEEFWECNYPTRYGWINITPRGELRSCTKKMDEVPGYTFLTLNKKKIDQYRQGQQTMVDSCNKDCYSNCAYDSYYYRVNKIATIKKALGIDRVKLCNKKYTLPKL
jgi:MoaA/NifB/PqqE/SkfB family radical SAM enzyme